MKITITRNNCRWNVVLGFIVIGRYINYDDAEIAAYLVRDGYLDKSSF